MTEPLYAWTCEQWGHHDACRIGNCDCQCHQETPRTDADRLCATCGRDIRHRGDNTLYCHPSCKRKAARRRRKERGPVLPPPLPPTHCVPCGKVACPTEDAARFAKRAVEDRAGRTNEVRYYRCPEGWWHWTRLDASLDGYRARTHPSAEEAS